MQSFNSFNLPLSKRLDFGIDSDGHAFFKAWDERTSLHLTPDEFAALFVILQENKEKLTRELPALQERRHE